MNGFEVCKKIKALDTENNGLTPIIFITGKGDLESMKIGLKSGAEYYLAKLFEPEELLARVQAVLRTKNLFNELMDAYAFIEREQDIIVSIQQSLLCPSFPIFPGSVSLPITSPLPKPAAIIMISFALMMNTWAFWLPMFPGTGHRQRSSWQ